MHKVFYLASDEFIRHDLNSTEVEKELFEKKKKIRVIFYRERKKDSFIIRNINYTRIKRKRRSEFRFEKD